MNNSNVLIEQLLIDANIEIPYAQGFYHGTGEDYFTYTMVGRSEPFYTDDDMCAWKEYIDFDLYSRSNPAAIENQIKPILAAGDFSWQPSRSSGDFYEPDTGYHHRTLCFEIIQFQEQEEK